jgi:hypothetical protein
MCTGSVSASYPACVSTADLPPVLIAEAPRTAALPAPIQTAAPTNANSIAAMTATAFAELDVATVGNSSADDVVGACVDAVAEVAVLAMDGVEAAVPPTLDPPSDAAGADDPITGAPDETVGALPPEEDVGAAEVEAPPLP